MKAKRLLKRFVFLVLVVVGCSTLALWLYGGRVFAYYKPRIEQLLSEKTGVTVGFESGNFTVYPYLGISLQNITVNSLTGCTPWRLSRASFKVDLVPLFSREVEIKQLYLEGLEGFIRHSSGSFGLTDNVGRECHQTPLVGSDKTTPKPNAKSDEGSSSPKGTTDGAFERNLDLSLEHLQVDAVKLHIFENEKPHLLRIEHAEGAFHGDAKTLELSHFSVNGGWDELSGDLKIEDLTSDPKLSNISLKSASLEVGKQSIEINGSYNVTAAQGEARATIRNFALSDVRKIVGTSVPMAQGYFNSQVEIRAVGDDITILGEAGLEGVRTTNPKFSMTSLKASDLSIELSHSALRSLKTKLTLDKFFMESEGSTYTVDHVEGPLHLSDSAGLRFGGELDVQNFGYADDETTIKRVAARLNNIVGEVDAKGAVDVAVDLDAKSVYLTNPSIEVKSVERVTGPIKVRVPATGYSVSGPVSILNGVLMLSGRELQSTSGHVAMLVTGPLKDFHSKEISAQSFKEQIETSTHFAMTADQYALDNTLIKIGAGTISPLFTMGRKGERPIKADVTMANLPIVESYRAVMQSEDVPIRGTATTITAHVEGNRSDLLNSLSGKGEAEIDNFIFQTIDIERAIKHTIAAIPLVGPDLVPSDTGPSPKAGSIKSSVQIANRLVTVPDLRLQLSNCTVEGAFSLGFDSKIKGTASVVFLEQTFRLLGFGFERLGNFLAREGRIAIPLLIGRTVTDPSIRPDVESIAKSLSGLNLIESVAGEVEDVGEEVADDL